MLRRTPSTAIRTRPASRDPGIGHSSSISNNGSIKWPMHIFTKWPFGMGHLQNTLRRYADKTEVDPMKLTLSAGLCALLFAAASLIGGYAQAASRTEKRRGGEKGR